MNIAKTKSLYYNTKFDKSLPNLEETRRVAKNFASQGEDRFMDYLSIRNINEEKLRKTAWDFINAKAGLDKEFVELTALAENYNKQYETDRVGYVDILSEALNVIAKHIEIGEKLFLDSCSRKHPSNRDCLVHGIEPRPTMSCSILGSGAYNYSIYGIESGLYPKLVEQVYHLINEYFKSLAVCMDLCFKVKQEEIELSNDPDCCLRLLQDCKSRLSAISEDLDALLSDEDIEELKKINPAYFDYLKCKTDKEFAQLGLHRYNASTMTHLFAIQRRSPLAELSLEDQNDLEEMTTEEINRVIFATANFDQIIPKNSELNSSDILYFYCQLLFKGKIKKGLSYLERHYHGKLKLVSLSAVGHRSTSFNPKSKDYIEMKNNIDNMYNTDVNSSNLQFQAAQ